MQDDTPRDGDRVAKLLARAGIASRREVERMIAEGRVAVDGTALTTPATVLTSLRGVTVDGAEVAAPAPARLFLFHKPAGTLTAARDFTGRRTIYDVLPRDLPRLVPVGRLDLNTEGLLLMTTDGGLKRQLELPSTGVERAYRARAYGHVTQAQLEELIDGIEIDGVRYGSIDANLERRTGTNVWIEMVLTEGKNREVRRVLEHLGLRVSRLIRTRYGPFVLSDLPEGAIGEVRRQDLVAFRQALTRGAAEAQAVPIAPPRRAGSAGTDDGEAVNRPEVATGSGRRDHPQRPRTPSERGQAAPARPPTGGGSERAGHEVRAGVRGPDTGRGSPPVAGSRRDASGDRSRADGIGAASDGRRGAVARGGPGPIPRQRPTPDERRPARDDRRPSPVPNRGTSASGPGRPHRTDDVADRTTRDRRVASPATVRPDTRSGADDRRAPPDDAASPRPPRPVKKPGWARAKPKPGPARPRKPRR